MIDNFDKNLTGFASLDQPSKRFYTEEALEDIRTDVEKTMFAFVEAKTTEDGLKDPCYKYFGERFDVGHFWLNVFKVVAALKNYGIGKGDVITLALPNVPETLFYIYAANYLGATVYPVDPRCTPERIKECMENSNAKLLVSLMDICDTSIDRIKNQLPTDKIVVVSPTDALIKSVVNAPFEATAARAIYGLKELNFLIKEKLSGDKKYITQDEFVKAANGKYSRNDLRNMEATYDPDVAAMIINTSGTTGSPKGAMISNLAYNTTAKQIKYVATNLEKGQTYFGYIPLFSLYGSSVGGHCALAHGIEIELIPKLNTHKFDEAFLKSKPNISIGVPRLYNTFPDSDKIKEADLSFAKLLVMGGDKCSPTDLEKTNEVLRQRGCTQKIKYGYGSTEAGMIASTPDDYTYYDPTSVGALYPGVTVRVTNPDTLEETEYGVEGEIYVNTPTMCDGYLNNTEETDKLFFVDPKTNVKYLKTGDKGFINDLGVLYVTGRYKRLMKRPDGHQVHSSPIENAIMKDDLVQDCAVVGIKSSKNSDGVIPTAFIQLEKEYAEKINSETAKHNVLEQIMQTCRENVTGEREMALAYVLVDRIPYTDNGKVDFRALEANTFDTVDAYFVDDPLFTGYFSKEKAQQLAKKWIRY